MTLTLKDLIKNGILNELAALFHEQEMADMLLDLIDFPVAMRPIFPNNGRTLGYWREICNQIQSGAVREGTDLQPLIDATVGIYPANPVFHQYCSDRTQPNNPNNQPSNTSQSSSSASQTQQADHNLFIISIQGRDDAAHLLASARVVAPGQSISPEHISLRFSGNGVVLLGLNNCNSEAVASFAGGLQTILQSNQNSVRVNIFSRPKRFLEGLPLGHSGGLYTIRQNARIICVLSNRVVDEFSC
ncbi:MAG: hypothetical protein KME30_25145 [Iphinoe sp. HA4291-MV1]|jgi:hypothetical protein|nr:hypothetical protein [Iphinoe sp. HA4291-MV1]